MNKSWQIFMGIVITALVITTFVLYIKLNTATKENQIKDVQLMMANDTVKQYKTKSGENYGKFNAVSIEANALKASLLEMNINNKDLKAKNIDQTKLIEILQGKIEAGGTITTVVHDTVYIPIGKDPIQAKYFNWNNKYLFLKGTLKENLLEAEYKYNLDFQFTTERIKNKSIVTVTLSDPNAQMITANQLIISPNKHWWDKWWIYGLTGMGIGIYIAK